MNGIINEKKASILIKEIIHSINGLNVGFIKNDDRLINDIGMDSVELIELLIKLEEYGLILNEDELSTKLTVNHLIVRMMGIL